MDSTKKVVRKLAGHSTGTAAWATNVANEHGQVLMNVLTASEGAGLKPMAEGLVKRYTNAGVSPPKLLYVDRDCCEGGAVKTKDLFKQWGDLAIRLDIWHFMRRIVWCFPWAPIPMHLSVVKRGPGPPEKGKEK